MAREVKRTDKSITCSCGTPFIGPKHLLDWLKHRAKCEAYQAYVEYLASKPR